MTWFLATLAHLIHLATPLLQTYGLWGLFGLLLAENLGVVFAPGESVVVTAGFLAAKGVFSIAVVLPLAMLAAILGGYLAYGLGAKYGHAGLVRFGKYFWITPEKISRVHSFFQRFGAPVVAIGRFIVPLRQLQGYIAGSAEMGVRAYAIWSAVGAVLWVLFWGGGAWWLAQSIPS